MIHGKNCRPKLPCMPPRPATSLEIDVRNHHELIMGLASRVAALEEKVFGNTTNDAMGQS